MYFHLFTFLTLAVLLHHSLAQNSDQEYLDAHNAARAVAGVGPMTWDAKVAAYALNHTNSRIEDCKPTHSINCPYGENLAKGSRAYSGSAAVKLWVAEKSNYNYSTNTCVPGMVCGHYTQVVWKNSVRLGCAKVSCRNNDRLFITTCSYDPPGNLKGQKPY